MAALAMLLLLLGASPAWAAVGAEEPSLLFAALKMVAALALCLGILFGGTHLLRRFRLLERIQGGEGVIKVVATRALGPKRYVSVVEVEGRRLVLGVAEGGVTLLDRLPGRENDSLERRRGVRLAHRLEDEEEL